MVVPLAAMYSPLKNLNHPVVGYEPVVCRGNECRAVLNPFCSIDVRQKIWACPFCLTRNQFPAHYADISPTNLPAELIPNYTTIEYTLRRTASVAPIFVYVVDTCLDRDEMQALRGSLILSLSLLPPTALVGLITYGQNVHVHELGFTECSKAYVFSGKRDYNSEEVARVLGLVVPTTSAARASGTPGASRFLQPLSDVEFGLTTLFEELQRDAWPVAQGQRPLRAGGVALSVATSLLEVTYVNNAARVMAFVGGPPTIGPGMIVSENLTETIRAHFDLEKNNAPWFGKAVKFYAELAKRLAQHGHVMDMFACSGNQTGVLEMVECVNRTGGLIVLADSFDTSMFKESFKRVFLRDANGDLLMGFNAVLEVQTSRELKVCGAIGAVSSVGKKSASVGETEIGLAGTCAWRMNAMTPQTTVALFFEVVNAGTTAMPPGQQGLVQLTTVYRHASGAFRLRVTTVARAWADPRTDSGLIAEGFDQDAATAVMARMASFKAEREGNFDIIRWIDRMLIRLCARFGTYTKDVPATFAVGPRFSMYPQFMFHLRRSQFLQVFNSSPDETAYYRHTLYREDVTNSLIMIQPSLLAYDFGTEPTPVLLDAQSILPNRILLLDSFFYVLIFHGETIAAWRKARYDENPEYASFKALLEKPREDALFILKDRWPVPRYIECEQFSSPARILEAKVNPSRTHTQGSAFGGGSGEPGQVVLTDDVSLSVFLEHLAQLAVQG